MNRGDIGAKVIAPGRVQFRVWSPKRERVELRIIAPYDRIIPMEKNGGYREAVVDARPGTRYYYLLDGIPRPDPASRFQPEGVHGASEVIDSAFDWHDAAWKGVALEDYVIYELHVGTFTPEGTLDAVIPKLDRLKELGITAIELLPIGQFPGTRNWGYDGVYINAVQNSYGGPLALKRVVDAAHQCGLSVILDVVYNHLGPEGNYLAEFGPYFTNRYKTRWGEALNFDGPYSDDVRWFFIHNALMWVEEFHIDALRVDAVHAIADHSAEPFLQDLTTAVGDRAVMIAESDLNDPRVIAPKEKLGLGFDTQWNDDFHHALHALLTGEKAGYYVGYGAATDLARVLSNGYLYVGQYSAYRGRKYGLKPGTTNGAQFIVYTQNHDQIGNRMHGERLAALVSREKARLAAAAMILSPFLPMLFMGEEYGEKAPFQYFTSHSDPDLIDAVRRGRQEEFEEFDWQGEAPDPHDERTFQASKLTWSGDAALRDFYRDLLRIRRQNPSLRSLDLAKVQTSADDERKIVTLRREHLYIAFNFGDVPQTIDLPDGSWRPLIDSAARVAGRKLTVPGPGFAALSE